MGQFWMVIRMDEKGRGTRWRHPSREAAVLEAKRLALLEGVEFGVLEVVEVITPDPSAAPICRGCGRELERTAVSA